jgi:hypothetical protein
MRGAIAKAVVRAMRHADRAVVVDEKRTCILGRRIAMRQPGTTGGHDV